MSRNVGGMVFVVLVAAVPCAMAQLTNPGFENGDLTGWTPFGGGMTVYQTSPPQGTCDPPPEGTRAAFRALQAGGDVNVTGGIYQRVAWSNSAATARVRFANCEESQELAGIHIGIDPTGGTDINATTIVWSCYTSARSTFGQSVARARAFSEAAVTVTGISSSFITVFIMYDLNIRPHSGWKIAIVDDVRLSSTPELPTNLSFERGTYEGWASRPGVSQAAGMEYAPEDHLLPGLMEQGLHDKGPSNGTYYQESVESYSAHKDAILMQRFTTDRGSGPATTVRASVDINTGGTQNSSGGGMDFNAIIRIGLDPTGGSNPAAGSVVWSSFYESPAWTSFEAGTSPVVQVNNAGPVVTLFIERWHKWAYEWNRSAIDNVRLWFNGTEYIESQGPANDMDGDLVADEVEDFPNPVAPKTNRLLPDSDGDGRTDGQEDANRNGQLDSGETNARNRDTDGDRLMDGVETRLSPPTDPLNPSSPASFTDADNDGLPVPADPNDNDTDSDDDRYSDGYEFAVLGSGAVSSGAQKPTLGDVNLDTFVTSLDALIVQSLFLQIIGPEAAIFHPGGVVIGGYVNCDANRDGFITSLDALIIQAYFLQIAPTLPI